MGYRCFLIDRNFNFHLTPKHYEIKSNLLPEKIFTNSEYYKNKLQGIIDSEIASPFRFEKIIKMGQLIDINNQKNILVALPIFRDLSSYIVKLINIVSKKSPKEHFIIKAHPSDNTNYIIDSINISYSNKNIYQLLEKSKIIITATSSICLEALALGINIIQVKQVNGLNQDPIPNEFKNQKYINCWNEEDIMEGIKQFSLNNKNTCYDSSIMEKYIGQITPELTKNIIKYF